MRTYWVPLKSWCLLWIENLRSFKSRSILQRLLWIQLNLTMKFSTRYYEGPWEPHGDALTEPQAPNDSTYVPQCHLANTIFAASKIALNSSWLTLKWCSSCLTILSLCRFRELLKFTFWPKGSVRCSLYINTRGTASSETSYQGCCSGRWHCWMASS